MYMETICLGLYYSQYVFCQVAMFFACMKRYSYLTDEYRWNLHQGGKENGAAGNETGSS